MFDIFEFLNGCGIEFTRVDDVCARIEVQEWDGHVIASAIAGTNDIYWTSIEILRNERGEDIGDKTISIGMCSPDQFIGDISPLI